MAVTTLFMVIFVRRGIKINKTGGNPVLYIAKKVFDQKMTIFSGFFVVAIFKLLDPSLAPEGPKLIFVAFIIFVGKNWIKMICHMPC